MQNRIFNTTLIKTGSQIQYWESPEPKNGDRYTGIQRDLKNNQYKAWLSSSKTLDVHPSAVEEIRDIAFKKSYKVGDGFIKELEGNGISLSGIEDRLYIDGGYFHLRPIPSKEEEGQVDLWNKVFEMIKRNQTHKLEEAFKLTPINK